MRAIWPGEYFVALEKVAEAAFVMCQHLDQHEDDVAAWSTEAMSAHDNLHKSLEPYERIKYGEDA